MGLKLSAVSMALLVMARKAYGEAAAADYPNLAAKAKFPSA
jgi:hypothetical protein